jgi:hypothetical protein
MCGYGNRRLLSARAVEGRVLWIEDKEDVWTRAKVQSQANTVLTCRRERDNALVKVDLVSDMTPLLRLSKIHILINERD